LVVYFLVSNTFRVFQQMLITRRYYGGKGEEAEVIRPEPAAGKAGVTETKASARSAGAGVNHGSRRPVLNPPKKPKKKPVQKKSPGGRSAPKKTPPGGRPESKRVTPKKNDQSDPGSGRGRRDKKKR